MKCLIISFEKNEVLHEFFRQKWSALLFLQKKGGDSLFLHKKISFFVWRNNAALDFALKKYWGTSFFSQEIMRHLIPWGTNEVHQFFWSNNEASVSWFLQIKTTCLIISSDKNEAPHYFFRKKWSTSLFLQKKMRHLIIS